MVRLVSIDHTAKKIVKLERDNKKIGEKCSPTSQTHKNKQTTPGEQSPERDPFPMAVSP